MIKVGTFLKIGNFLFKTDQAPRGIINRMQISSSHEDFTDTLTVTIPRKLSYRSLDSKVLPVINDQTKLPVFNPDDAVTLGIIHNEQMVEYFRGTVDRIMPKRPMVIECEDKMRKYKQLTAPPTSINNTTLPAVLDVILPKGDEYQAEDLQLGNFRLPKRVTISQLLEWFKKTFGMISYISRDARLIVGFLFETELQANIYKAGTGIIGTKEGADRLPPKPIIIEYGKNLIDDSDLIYVREDQMKVKVQVIVYYPVNSPRHPDTLKGNVAKVPKQVTYPEKGIDEDIGDPLGGVRTLYIHDVDKDAALKFGKRKLKLFKYDGFTGRLTTFLIPRIKPGDTVKINHKELPDQEGRYWVKHVNSSYGMDGGRQIVELDRKVTDEEIKGNFE